MNLNLYKLIHAYKNINNEKFQIIAQALFGKLSYEFQLKEYFFVFQLNDIKQYLSLNMISAYILVQFYVFEMQLFYIC